MSRGRILYILGLLVLSGAYLGFSLWLQNRGFYNLESYFMEYKAEILEDFDSSFLRTFYFTRPALLFLLSLPFSLIFEIHGTFILNAILIGALTNHLLFKSITGDYTQKIFISYLLFSPVILYAGISGGSLALYLVFYFLFFNILLKYNDTQSVFHLTLLSILLGTHIFMDIFYVKLILLVIPVLFVIEFFKAKGINGNFFYRSAVIFSNSSQRRKLFTGFFASVLILSFIPGMSYLIFLVINKIFAGDYFFFKKSFGDSWDSYSSLFPIIDPTEFFGNEIPFSSTKILILALLLSSTIIFKLFDYSSIKGTKMALFLALLYVISESSSDKISDLNLSHLSVLTGAGLAAFYTTPHIKITTSRKRLRVIPLLIPFIAIGLEFKYFQNSLVETEKLFVQTFEKPTEPARTASIKNIKQFLSRQKSGKILTDDAIFYPELTVLHEKFTWEGRFSPLFIFALQEPKNYPDYILITKSNHPFHFSDIVATSINRAVYFDKTLETEIIFEDDMTQILSIKNSLSGDIK